MYVYVLLYWYEMVIGALVGKKFINSPCIIKSKKGRLEICIKSMIVFFIVLLPLVIVMGGRNDIGTDTDSYRYIFDKIAISGLSGVSGIEIGYKLINMLISTFTSNNQWLFVICAIMICSNFCKFFKNINAPLCIMLSIFLGYGYYFYAMNIMRQYLSISIVLANIYKIEKGEKKKFVISVLIAALFHTSSLIWLIVPIVQELNSKKFYLLTFGLSLCARLGISGVVYLLKYTIYGHFFLSNSKFVSQKISYMNIFFTSVVLIIYLLMKNKINGVNSMRVKCAWMAFLAYVMLNPFGGSIIRLVLGFQIYATAIIGESISELDPQIRKIATVCIVVLGFLGMCVILNLPANKSQHFIPYVCGNF